MEGLVELLIELFGDVLGNLILQIIGIVGEHVAQPYRHPRPRSAILSILSHVVFGAALGGLSLLVVRDSLVAGELTRVAMLFLSPLIAGGFSALVGWILLRRGKETVPLERFGYAYLFAFSASGVRFLATM